METCRRNLVLYTTAVCNLNCSYCYIDKNPALQKIDNLLDQSFQGDYYFNFAKEMFPDPKSLKEIQFWGGEPTLRLDRAYNTVSQLIEFYPNLSEFMFSTNFTTSNWFEQVEGFLMILNNFSFRKFTVNIQLSIDGPQEINDLGRGKGVTEKFIEHWKELILFVKNDKIPSNVKLNTFFKPTLSIETIPLLQTKDAIIQYYKFFETFKESIEYYEGENFSFDLPIPNTACPSPHTKQDGILFANLCRLTREIEKDANNIFKYYQYITPFTPRRTWNKNEIILTDSCRACGMGLFSIGLLPNNKISLCHNGFVDLISDYKQRCMEEKNLLSHSIDYELFNRNTIVRDTNCSKEEFQIFEKMLKTYYEDNSVFQLSQLINQIQLLALTDMIDKKYMNLKQASDAAHFIQSATSYCIRDNLGSSGTIIGNPLGLLKLLLNGAKEEIENG